MNNYSQVPINALEPQFKTWSHYLQTHRSANLFFLKNTGMLTRLLQFADWYGQTIKKPITHIDIDTQLISSPRDFDLALQSLSSDTILIVRDHFTHPDSAPLEIILQQYYLTSPYSLLVVHECAPHELLESSSPTPSLRLNQSLYSPPTEAKDLQKYIYNICKLWSIKLSADQINSCLRYCGNNLWLINEYIRMQINNPKHIVDQIIVLPTLKYRVNALFTALPRAYHEYFASQNTDVTILNELVKFNLLDNQGNPIGHWLIDSIKSHQSSLLVITPSQIIHNHVDFSLHFSPGEKQILNFVDRSQIIHSREAVARAFYGHSSPDYSDWALSQAITRLRSKLSKLNIPIEIIPKRGKGYAITRK